METRSVSTFKCAIVTPSEQIMDDDVVEVRDVVVTIDAMDATIRTPRRQSARSTPRASRTVGHRRHDIDG